MCGIAGIFGLGGDTDLTRIMTMTQAVRHRGPDDEGVVFFHGTAAEATCFGGKDTPSDVYHGGYLYSPKRAFDDVLPHHPFAALGHRRLSILDLSPAGHQPMCSADGRYWIVHNGEVYNYVELRRELEAVGFVFQSHTDTEVILSAYQQWGHECLHRFNGMFAFVIFDRQTRTVFAARDRFGVKPLYYWISPRGYLAFASEIKQFMVLQGWRAVLNGQRGYDFLNWSVNDHTRETLFEGVLQFSGGECVECGLSNIKDHLPVKRWYHVKGRQFDGDLQEAATALREMFIDAVRLRLRADVPVGTSFSGGIDSSSVVCVVSNLLNEKDAREQQKTFSSCSDIEKYDEQEFIKEVVRRTNVKAHHTFPSPNELFEVLDAIAWHHDEPFLTTSIYAEWLVFKLIAQNGVKVTLDGHGADELLAGYYAFFTSLFAKLAFDLRWFELWRQMKKTAALHRYRMISLAKHTTKLLSEMISPSLVHGVRKLLKDSSWLNMGLLGARADNPEQSIGIRPSSIQKLSLLQLVYTSLPKQLHWADRDSMTHSVESRLPFLDYRLVEFMLGLPDEFKVSGGVTKRVLREAMMGILPEKIRCRTDKMGFVTPEEVWMRETSPDRFRNALKDAVEQSRGVINPDIMEKGERIISGKAAFDFLIWRVISFGKWMNVFSVYIK